MEVGLLDALLELELDPHPAAMTATDHIDTQSENTSSDLTAFKELLPGAIPHHLPCQPSVLSTYQTSLTFTTLTTLSSFCSDLKSLVSVFCWPRIGAV